MTWIRALPCALVVTGRPEFASSLFIKVGRGIQVLVVGMGEGVRWGGMNERKFACGVRVITSISSGPGSM